MGDTDVVPVISVKSVKSHHKKKKGPAPTVKNDDGTEKPFITIVRPVGGVWLSATS